MLRRALPLAVLLLFAANGAAAFAQETPAKTGEQKDAQKTEGTQKTVGTQKTDSTPTPQATPKPSAARYKELLEKLKKGERDVNFTELRMSYAESEDYSPYGGDRDARKAMFAALNASNWDEALKQSSKILEKNYVDINGHFGAFAANARKGDTTKADFHKYVVQGLIDSVRGGGDGRSIEKAFVVISTDEEYALMNFLGLRVMSQSLLNDGGHAYDKLATVDPETKQTYDFYFQIDIPFGWLGRSLKGSSEEKKP